MPCDNASRRGRGMSQPSLRWAPRPSLVTNSPSARGAYVTEDWGRLVHEGHRSFRHYRRELAQLVIADAVTFFPARGRHDSARGMSSEPGAAWGWWANLYAARAELRAYRRGTARNQGPGPSRCGHPGSGLGGGSIAAPASEKAAWYSRKVFHNMWGFCTEHLPCILTRYQSAIGT